MGDTRITVNGQHYDSPDAMPPDVRRTYEDALRLARSSVTGAPRGETSRTVVGRTGRYASSSIVVDRIVVHRGGGGPEPTGRDAGQRDATAPHTGFHVSLEVERGHDAAAEDASRPTLPLESSDLEARIREIPVRLAIGLAVVLLVLWAFFNR